MRFIVRTSRPIRVLTITAAVALGVATWILPPPGWWIAMIVLVCWAAFEILRPPSETALRDHAEGLNPNPDDEMTLYEVADIAGMSWKDVPRALERAGVSRSDATGWRARLPVVATHIRYRRDEVQRWLDTRNAESGSKPAS